jgi:hypothetical protein
LAGREEVVALRRWSLRTTADADRLHRLVDGLVDGLDDLDRPTTGAT